MKRLCSTLLLFIIFAVYFVFVFAIGFAVFDEYEEDEVTEEMIMGYSKIELEESSIEESQQSTLIEYIKIEDEYRKACDDMNEEINNINTEDKLEWYKSYKEIIAKYNNLIASPLTVYDVFSSEEIYLIQRMVETECYQRDFESKVNVASVAFNRFESDRFPDDITTIITSQNQFAYWRTDISEDTILAVEYAYEIEDSTGGAIGFHSNPKTETFNGWIYLKSDKSHNFYGLIKN